MHGLHQLRDRPEAQVSLSRSDLGTTTSEVQKQTCASIMAAPFVGLELRLAACWRTTTLDGVEIPERVYDIRLQHVAETIATQETYAQTVKRLLKSSSIDQALQDSVKSSEDHSAANFKNTVTMSAARGVWHAAGAYFMNPERLGNFDLFSDLRDIGPVQGTLADVIRNIQNTWTELEGKAWTVVPEDVAPKLEEIGEHTREALGSQLNPNQIGDAITAVQQSIAAGLADPAAFMADFQDKFHMATESFATYAGAKFADAQEAIASFAKDKLEEAKTAVEGLLPELQVQKYSKMKVSLRFSKRGDEEAWSRDAQIGYETATLSSAGFAVPGAGDVSGSAHIARTYDISPLFREIHDIVQHWLSKEKRPSVVDCMVCIYNRHDYLICPGNSFVCSDEAQLCEEKRRVTDPIDCASTLIGFED